MLEALKFEVYEATDGIFRSRLIDLKGKTFVARPNGLPKDLDPEDAEFYRSNVQFALERLLSVGENQDASRNSKKGNKSVVTKRRRAAR